MKAQFLKRGPLLILGAAIIVTTAHALIDADTDGMSDVWEQQHGFSITSGTLPAHQAPTADADGDGWTNLEESQAGTDPNSGTPPLGILRPTVLKHPDFSTVFTISWPSLEGKQYTLYASPDLSTGSWIQVDEPVMGTGAAIEYGTEAFDEDGYLPERLFWKVSVSDVDSDGDTLADYEELALNYNPHHVDTDLDGFPDNTDPLPLSNAAIASPDSAGFFGTTLTTNMTGRWDFESYDTNFSPPTGYTPWSFPDQTAGARKATSFLGGTHINQEGMVSKATQHAGGFVTIPPSLLNVDTSYSVSFWAALDQGSVENSNGQAQGLFAHHNYLPHITSGSPNWALVKAISYGIWVQKINGREILRAGGITYTNHNNGNLLNPPTTVVGGVMLDRDLGTIDDGQYHHYVLIKSGSNTTLYIDGTKYGPVSHPSDPIVNNSYTGTSLGRIYGPSPDSIPVQPGNQSVARGRFDRLRTWSDNLTDIEIDALYREDIDRDGLWDITENRSSLWRDANSDEIRTSVEVSYGVNPFLADPAGADHDRDGIPSVEEQTIFITLTDGRRRYLDIFDADSDDDGLPDGYDRDHGLGPLVPDTNLNSDTDGDTLTLAQELAYGTDPTKKDTDGDLKDDNIEVGQNSRPNDASDNGQPPPAGETYSLKLAIGDESGSDSEDYHLVVNRYDPGTRTETEIYRLRSGGFGQYSGYKTISFFKKSEEYTFRIHWQGSNLKTNPSASPSEGPDYDYTMRVESVGGNPEIVITDAFDVAAGIPEAGYQLLGQKNDVPNFQGMSETVGVHIAVPYIDLAVDTNMNGSIESLPDGQVPQNGNPWPTAKIDDRQLDDENPPRAVVIDVNNNNTDSGKAQSPTSGQVDNENTLLDTAEDKAEMTSTRSGHAFGNLKVYALAAAKFKSGEYSLKLSFADPSHAEIVRVFDWRDYSAEDSHPSELLGPGKLACTFDNTNFFGTDFNAGGLPEKSFRTLVMEGLTYGTATLRLELIKNGATPEVISTDEVRVCVNVDRFAQAPADVAGNKDARHLRGESPHHVGLRKTGLTTGDGIRAIRGTMSVRVPGSNGKTRLTPMFKNILRPSSINGDNASSGASIWVGLTERDGDGNLSQWVQSGIRWVQPSNQRAGSVPAFYLETGDAFEDRGAKSLNQAAAATTNPAWLGDGLGEIGVAPLDTWETAPIKYSFILFKEIKARNELGDISVIPWKLVIKDERPGIIINNSNFVYLSLDKPVLPGTSGASAAAEIEKRYKAQAYRDLDALFETNQSITFAAGSPNEHALISGLHFATTYAGSPGESPNPNAGNGKQDLYNWAFSAFDWSTVTTTENDVDAEIKSGKSQPNGAAEEGSTSIPTGSLLRQLAGR
jgi:hypothetical protein